VRTCFFSHFFCPRWLLFCRPRPPPSPRHSSPCFSSLLIPFSPSSLVSLVLGPSSGYRCGSSFVVIGCWASRMGVVVVWVVVVVVVGSGCGGWMSLDVVGGCSGWMSWPWDLVVWFVCVARPLPSLNGTYFPNVLNILALVA
jgi:hypothetical protein